MLLTCLLWFPSGNLRAETIPAPTAESAPALSDLVMRCDLIVHCRTEEVDGRMLYKVLDVLKGDYDPSKFVSPPPTGYIDTTRDGLQEQRRPGAEVVLFYVRDHQSRQGIDRHDMPLPVVDGHVTYPPGGRGLGSGSRISLDALKRGIALLVGSAAGPDRYAGKAERMDDLSGIWRMFLPAGFEREVNLVRDEAGRYRFKAGGTRFDGMYEIEDRRLVCTVPNDAGDKGLAWRVRSPYMLALDAEPQGGSGDYAGAILFRPTENGRILSAANESPVPRWLLEPVDDARAVKEPRF
jgi:hypothetical protein